MLNLGKFSLATVIIIVSIPAMAAGLKITEKYDDFTKSNYLEGKQFSVCQLKKAGMVPCGTFGLRWSDRSPDVIYVYLETGGDYVSMTEIWFNIGGKISRIEAGSSVTDFEYDESAGHLMSSLGKRSANSFEVPVSVLKEVTESSENGIVRVTGINHVADYDFYRKHMFKLPFELLRDFVDRVESAAQSENVE